MRESIDPILKRKPTRTEPAPHPHRSDEFPAGYPLAGCSPAEPTSVSPTTVIMPPNRSVGDDSPANGNLSPSQLSQGWGSLHYCVPSPQMPQFQQNMTGGHSGLSPSLRDAPVWRPFTQTREPGDSSQVLVLSVFICVHRRPLLFSSPFFPLPKILWRITCTSETRLILWFSR